LSGPRDVPALARGVRIRTLDDGSSVLLIPEGIVKLNQTAAAALELVDGRRTIASIASVLRSRFASAAGSIDADVLELFARMNQQGWVFFSSIDSRA